jgi:2-(1,2-epoxy-1,2-dihydrophenyl)acetyl-CoA isomerase
MPEAAAPLLTARDDGIATLTFNRPEARNALSPDMLDLLTREAARCAADEVVRCVVLRGAGAHFMAGGDVRAFQAGLMADRAAHVAGFPALVAAAHAPIDTLRRMAKPVLAAVQGAVAGFGFSLLLAADLAIAADDAFFTLAYRHIGLSPDGGASYLLPRIVGERRALEIALLGERFGAAEAASLGLVNRVVPRADLDRETDRLAAALASGPTRALGLTKALLRGAHDAGWAAQGEREAAAMAACVATSDHLEGVTAFLEKRAPRFTGR